jgi:hypothetical protein
MCVQEKNKDIYHLCFALTEIINGVRMKLEEPVIHMSGQENANKILVGKLLDKYLYLNGRM